MPDRERVVKAWKIFRDSNPYEICSGREFRAIREPEYCMGQMIEDTIALLKEQEPQPVKVVKNAYNHEFYYCPKCDRSFYELLFVKPKFCDKCGQEITWNGSD